MDSEQLRIKAILDGDEQAFRELIVDYQRLVAHVIFRMVQQEHDREELCQEVFIKVYRNLPAFENRSRLSTWIARIAYNTTLNYLQKKKVGLYEDLPVAAGAEAGRGAGSFLDSWNSGEESAETRLFREDSQRWLHQKIKQLPPQFRAIITLYHLDNMSYADIGMIMDLPEGTVKSYLFRARKKLKELLVAGRSEEELHNI